MKRSRALLLFLALICCGCGSHGDPSKTGKNGGPSGFAFVQISDLHIGKSPQQEENLRHAVAQINQMDAAFALLTGDLTDRGRLEEYATLKDVLSGLSVPYQCVPGDNDIIDGEGDLNRYREELGPDFDAFDFEGVRFIGINNVFHLSLDEDRRGWLAEHLNEDVPAVVFAHSPLLDKNLDFAPFRLAEPLLELLSLHRVLLYLNGDAHEPAETEVDGTYHIWCDNLSFLHTGVETYNLFKVRPDRIELYHAHFDGRQEFILTLSSQR
jgi:hypothetical protein